MCRSPTRTSTSTTCATRTCAGTGSRPRARTRARRLLARSRRAATGPTTSSPRRASRTSTASIHVGRVYGTEDVVDETRWLQTFAERIGVPHGIVAPCDLAAARRRRRARRHTRHRRSCAASATCATTTTSPTPPGAAARRCSPTTASCSATTRCWSTCPTLARARARHPGLTICVDHAGFPRHRDDEYFAAWRAGMAQLAALRQHRREDLGSRHDRPRMDGRVAARVGVRVYRAVGHRAQLLRHQLAGRPALQRLRRRARGLLGADRRTSPRASATRSSTATPTASSASRGSADRVPARIGVIGCGWWATQAHLPALVRQPGRRPRGAGGSGRDAPAHGGRGVRRPASLHRRRRDARRPPSWTAVVVAVPHAQHYPLARLALEHGKHVLLEKPMTIAPGHAHELLALARARGSRARDRLPLALQRAGARRARASSARGGSARSSTSPVCSPRRHGRSTPASRSSSAPCSGIP